MDEVARNGGRWKPSMDDLVGKEGERLRNDETVMDSRKEWQDGVENDEIYLLVVTVFAGDVRGGRKSSPNLRRKFAGTQAVDAELRRGVEGAMSGGSR
jgi:hypothetical protein